MSTTSDFDFIIGDWLVHHHRLKERLAGSSEWVEFDGTSSTHKILDGSGNVEDNYLGLPEGPYRAAALRSFNSATLQWSIWWLDARSPGQLDTPVVGHFEKGRGVFFANDRVNGIPVRIRFVWTSLGPDFARWEQAFSADGGDNWETNWTMDFVRDSADPIRHGRSL